ncbi:hypothetical protein N0V88_005538 [Collariella sp. IMI 366227]|nr:hypothetical protein N0V88_005538 [Collariella sp. IMI 366227]
MSRTMSALRMASLPLAHGARLARFSTALARLATPQPERQAKPPSRFQQDSRSPDGTPAQAVPEPRVRPASEARRATISYPTPVPRPVRITHPALQNAASQALKPVDTSSKEYKRQARKVTSVIVALPIAIVTSYFLYDRPDRIGRFE